MGRVLLIVALLWPALGAGALSFRRLAIPDDVPADLCSALVQDQQGFLWIGTQSGLVRFDGQHFRRYPPAPGASYVRNLLAARDGRVWAGTFSGGVIRYDPATEQFTQVRDGLAHTRVEGLAEDRAGNIWIATQEGLDRLDPKTNRIEHFRHDPNDPSSLADDRARGLLVDSNGTLWVGSRAGLQRFRDGRFDPVIPALAGEFVSKLYEDERGRIWIGTTETGAWLFDPRTNDVRRLDGLSHFWIYGFAQANAREMWIATFGAGIDILDMDTLALREHLGTDATLPSTIPGDRIGALLRDRSGVMWVGTWGQGIARHDPSARAFHAIRYSPTQPRGLSNPSAVRAMQMRDGTIWVGTNGNGVDVLDANFQRVRTLFPGTAVTCLAEGVDGTKWVAMLNGDLHRIRDGVTTTLTKSDGLPGGAIRAIVFGANGEAWIGAAEGMARIDERGVTVYRHDRANPATLSGHAVESLAFDRSGRLWVGTDAGLNVFDTARGTATRITSGLPNNWVPDLLCDSRGRMWIGTNGGACLLESWDGKTARFVRVADRIKRPATPAESLIEDDQGQLWIGARLRVNPETWASRELTAADGCEFPTFFIASRSKMRDGSLLFGSPQGLLVVQPRELRPWTYAPPIVATSLRVDGRERAMPRELELAAGDRGFRLDFAALDFTSPERNVYRYRLEGYDRNWITADAARRSLTYTNLHPGAYTLHVQGTNRAGVWSPRELRLRVDVLPAFYETWWFRTLCIAALVLLAYAIYRLRVRQLEARRDELERLVRERTKELEVAYVRIEEASLTDPLTGLRNRRFLEQAIGNDIEMVIRRGDDLIVLLVDLDHFKSVNDTYGHAAGDAVLVQTAQVLRSVFRASDYIVRWGGEEFLVVARFVSRREAGDLAEKLRVAIATHPFTLPDGTVLSRTCSIGVASFPGDVTWEQTVGHADEALYEAKRSGRNRCVAA
ncbi:MAG TPA: two-component regulator propeller domain-containing protein [Thermoanaerobaculia bacterium]